MSVPKPRILEDKLGEIARLSIDLLKAGSALKEPYRWAYAYGLQTSVTGESGGSTQIAYSNPTLSVVESLHKERVRAACVDAARALDDAVNGLKQALKLVDAASGGLTGAKKGVMPTANVWDHAGAFREGKNLDHAHGAGKAEDRTFLEPGQLEEAKRRQKERHGAGEGFGET